jgi:lipopolysaccharide biosynthesis glycosyltransferase
VAGVPRPSQQAKVTQASAWSRLAAAIVGRDEAAESGDPTKPRDAIRLANRLRAEAVITEALATGESLEQAVCRAVASLAGTGDWRDLNTAWALTEGVGRLPDGTTASALGRAILRHRQGQFGRASGLLSDLPDDLLRIHVPVEAIDGALGSKASDGRQRALAIGIPTATTPPDVLVELAGRFLAFGERDRARELIAELRRRAEVDLDPRHRDSAAYLEAALDRPPTVVPDGAIPIAVMGFGTPDPDEASTDIGDYVQSLGLIASLVRWSGLSFSGDDGLGDLATELQARVRSDLRLESQAARVHLVPVDRDLSSVADVPEGTWLFAFGRHMRSLYDLRYDFPYHPNLRPLFISFHVSRLDMLTDEALDYLRSRGPIGCRDWTTVYLLLSAGVDAFFSGCASTTVDAVFPLRGDVYRGGGPVGVIDVPARAAGAGTSDDPQLTHKARVDRPPAVADGLRAAMRVLEEEQRELDRAATGRLHTYLALTALGVPVEFRPASPGDARFAGLLGLRPGSREISAMQAGIRDLLVRILEKILSGGPASEVDDLWRALTRDRVVEARQRFDAPTSDPPANIDMTSAISTSLEARRTFGPNERVDPARVTDVVLAFDQNLTYPAAVLIESLVTNASGPLRLWVLGRGLSAAYQEWVAAAFPSLLITFLPCDHIAYRVGGGRPTRIPARITISTMDRLVLPDMLPDVHRVVYADIDTIVLGDICALASLDLEGHAIAARHSTVSEASEWFRAVRGLPEPDATELRRVMFASHGFGHPALNAGVLVLDLDRMRRDDFTRRYLAWVEHYELNDQDTMLAYVGPQRRVIDPSWNALPHLEDVRDPKLIHWTSLTKPWDRELTYGQEVWQAYASRLQERAGPPPAA